MTHLLSQIEAFVPDCPQEEKDKQTILSYAQHFGNLLTRENEFAHFTASGLVLSPDGRRTLMVYHNIFDSWSWLGGHADGEEDLLAVAIREVGEESGVKTVGPLSEEIFSLDILPVWGHFKNGSYVSAHQHLSVCYLLWADDKDIVSSKPDENSGVRWVPVGEMVPLSTEPGMKQVYHKLLRRACNRGYVKGPL